jgi:hypothetical protein
MGMSKNIAAKSELQKLARSSGLEDFVCLLIFNRKTPPRYSFIVDKSILSFPTKAATEGFRKTAAPNFGGLEP